MSRQDWIDLCKMAGGALLFASMMFYVVCL